MSFCRRGRDESGRSRSASIDGRVQKPIEMFALRRMITSRSGNREAELCSHSNTGGYFSVDNLLVEQLVSLFEYQDALNRQKRARSISQ